MSREIELIREHLNNDVATRKEIVTAALELGIKHGPVLRKAEKISHGVYKLETALKKTPIIKEKVVNFRPKQEEVNKGYVPEKDPCFVAFGDFSVVDSVIASKRFMPVVITGDSGNGKTKMVEQACAKNRRNFYRMNITVETDEMDILGHYNLINGQTVWEDSPLVEAAKVGGIVLLDEVFAGNPARMLALQGILEGKPFLIKKTGERVIPAEGFNIIATDNTKGNGSESGRYIGTNIQNTAFLERFVMCIDHDYPPKTKEIKMLDKYIEVHNIKIDDEDYTNKLAQWAEVTRKSYQDGAIDELITTRRLFHILDIYSVLNDKEKAIQYAISRFDEEVKDSFLSLYKKIDETILDPNHQPIDKENLVSLETLVLEVFNEKEKEHHLLESENYDERYTLFKAWFESSEEYAELEQSYDKVLQADTIYQRKLLIESKWNIFDSAS
jgi:ATP-dependent Lon protease